MIVVTLSSCPSSLKGDLTLWMQEISTGVYVGNLSARVRDELWQRIISNVEQGTASMIYSSNNEQRMEFRVHNSGYKPIEFDGLFLVMKENKRINGANLQNKEDNRFRSKAKSHLLTKEFAKASSTTSLTEFVVISMKTTGINPSKDSLIEIAALTVVHNEVVSEHHIVFLEGIPVPKHYDNQIEITGEMLAADLKEGLVKLQQICDGLSIVTHSANLDYNFLRIKCLQVRIPLFRNPVIDTSLLARKSFIETNDLSLSGLSQLLSLENKPSNHALDDCLTTLELYLRLCSIKS